MAITLKAARVNVGMTQAEAAKAIGVSKDSISNWERGKTYPSISLLSRIEEVYGITYKDIIFLPS